jgi:hypothetical protein
MGPRLSFFGRNTGWLFGRKFSLPPFVKRVMRAGFAVEGGTERKFWRGNRIEEIFPICNVGFGSPSEKNYTEGFSPFL